MFVGTLSLNSNKLNSNKHHLYFIGIDSNQCSFPITERVLNLVTYIQWENPQVIEYDKICNRLKALSEILSIYSYIIMCYIMVVSIVIGLNITYFVVMIIHAESKPSNKQLIVYDMLDTVNPQTKIHLVNEMFTLMQRLWFHLIALN